MALITNIHWIALGVLLGGLLAILYFNLTGSTLKWKK